METPGDTFSPAREDVVPRACRKIAENRRSAESNMKRNARLLPAFCFFTVLMSGAAIKSDRFRITILAADSQTLNTNPDQPTRDCDLANYSGYCHERKVALVRNTMRVQEGNGNSF